MNKFTKMKRNREDRIRTIMENLKRSSYYAKYWNDCLSSSDLSILRKRGWELVAYDNPSYIFKRLKRRVY